jgi:hypothetical protein
MGGLLVTFYIGTYVYIIVATIIALYLNFTVFLVYLDLFKKV